MRILRAAARALIMTGIYAAAAAFQDQPWRPGHLTRWAEQPYTDWRTATVAMIHGHVQAALLTVPAALPPGLAIGGALWAWRCHRMTNGLAGRTALAPAAWDNRQWRRQAATARRDAKAPGRVPLAVRKGVPAGTVIRTVRARWSRVLVIPAAEFGRHMAIIGAAGSGKTTLMIRLWAGWFAATARAARRERGPRPLLVVIDGKGGPDSRTRAAQTAAALTAAGAGRVAIWPDHASLSLWDIPARDLAVLLHQLIETGDGAAAYYADMSAAVIRLAVCAPAGPPRSAAEFLERLNPGWLASAYKEGSPADREQVSAAKTHVPDIAMRYAILLDRLGPALDGTGSLTDPHVDAWYCILEGTAEQSVAEAQAMALTELTARAAVSPGPVPRRILLAADDYSAVSRRVPLSNLYERGRSLGLGIQVSAQSWEGLGADTDERKRITSTADGGVWLLRTPDPEPLVTLAGTRKILESGRKMLTPGRTGDEGTTRVQHTWTVDPDRIRQLATGQAVYIHHGTAVYIQVAPAITGRRARKHAPQPAPAAPPRTSPRAETTPAVTPEAAPGPAWPGPAWPAPPSPGLHPGNTAGPDAGRPERPGSK